MPYTGQVQTTLDLARPNALSAVVARPNLAGLTRPDLARALVEADVCPPDKARMRATQLWRWLHHFGVTDLDRMTDVSKDMRTRLADRFTLTRPEVVERQVSADGTRKWLIRFAPGIEAETVYIPDVGRVGALCISSQVGCTLNCTFCHTGTQALVRNLTAAEITAQVQVARDDLADWPRVGDKGTDPERALSNIVFMGMGEPLYNLDNVVAAVEILSDNEGLTLSRRRITVSTAGVVPQLPALGERANAMLAISLHAVRDDLRDELVPLNRKYPIAELLRACREYPGVSNARRITFEYVMLRGVNDTDADARELVRLLRGIPAKINLIPFNPWPGSRFECSDWGRIERFSEIVFRAGYASPVRTPRGRDILAACGQLKSDTAKLSARARLLLDEAGASA